MPRLVVVLLFHCCPPAVAGMVPDRVSHTVDCVLGGRLWPHVGQEVAEYQPSVANINSGTAVSIKTGIIGVRAPLHHSDPGPVFARPLLDSVVPVREPVRDVSSEAPAASRATSFKVGANRNSFATAFACALPAVPPRSVSSGIAKYSEPSETATDEILESRISWNRIGFSHDRSLKAGLVRAADGVSAPSAACILWGRE